MRVPCRGESHRHAGPVDLRRSLGRDERADGRLCDAGGHLGAGVTRPGARRADGDARITRAGDVLLRRVPHVARGEQDHPHPRRSDQGGDRRRAGACPSRPGADAGAARHPRHGAQSGHVLPGARGGQPLLRPCARHRAAGDGSRRRAHRPLLHAVPLQRSSRGGSRRDRDRLGLRSGRRDGRVAERARREGGRAERGALPPLGRGPLSSGVAADRQEDRRARSHEGSRWSRRTAVSRRRHHLRRGARRREDRVDARHRRRAVRVVLEGLRSGDGEDRLRRAEEAGAQARLHHRYQR